MGFTLKDYKNNSSDQIINNYIFKLGSLCILATALLLFFIFNHIHQTQHQKQFKDFNDLLAEEVAASIAPYLKANDLISVNQILQRQIENDATLAVSVSDSSQQVVANLGPVTIPPEALQISKAISVRGELIGTLEFVFSPMATNITHILLLIVLTAILIGVWLPIAWVINSQLKKQENNLLTLFNNNFEQYRFSNLLELTRALEGPLNNAIKLIGNLLQSQKQETLDFLVNQSEVEGFEPHYGDMILVWAGPNPEAYEPTSEDNPTPAIQDEITKALRYANQLYDGQFTQFNNCLGFSVDENHEEAAIKALCAAQLIFDLCDSACVSVVPGTLWLEPADFPGDIQVHGHQVEQLMMLNAHNPGQSVLISEALFQHQRVNELVKAEIDRDLLMSDGSRLEIWRLEELSSNYSQLISNQAQQLRDGL